MALTELERLTRRISELEDQVARSATNNAGIDSYSAFGPTNILADRIISSTPQLIDITWSNNSPSAGYVSWTAGLLIFHGEVYDILPGNSNSPFIVWVPGTRVLTGQAAYDRSVYLITSNVGGVANESWDRGGTALSSIQEDNLSFALLSGMAVQIPAVLSLTNVVMPSSGLPYTTTYTILNIIGPSALVSLFVKEITPWTLTRVGSDSNGDLDISFRVTVNGAAPQLIQAITRFPTGSGAGTVGPEPFDDNIFVFGALSQGDGTNANDRLSAQINLPADQSLKVELVISTTFPGTGAAASRTLAGTVKFGVGYALKV